jgi:hypothetical protein
MHLKCNIIIAIRQLATHDFRYSYQQQVVMNACSVNANLVTKVYHVHSLCSTYAVSVPNDSRDGHVTAPDTEPTISSLSFAIFHEIDLGVN